METFLFAILKKLCDTHMGQTQMREYLEWVLSKLKREKFYLIWIFHAVFERVPIHKGEMETIITGPLYGILCWSLSQPCFSFLWYLLLVYMMPP